MRVLLTGHLGYIGSVLTPMLAAAGHEIVGLDTGYFDPCLLPNLPAPEAVPTLHRDLRDLQPRDLEGFDAVLHLAGISNDPIGNLNPDLTYEINETGSITLARLAKQAGVSRFVFSSSCSNYGAAGADLLDESAAFSPVTPYAVSKVRMEQALRELADDRFSPVSLRNGTAYGVSPRLRLDLVLNDFVANAVTSGRILIKSDGTPWRPIVHIEDISRTFLAVLEAPREVVHDRAFNVGRTSENYRVSELATIVAETVPGAEVVYAPGGEPDKRSYRVSCDLLARTLPGLELRWDARRGAVELARVFRDIGLRAEDLAGSRFIRLRRIKELLNDGRLDADLRWVRADESAG